MVNTWSEIVTAWAAWVVDPESNPPVQWYNYHSGLSEEKKWENWLSQESITKTLNGLVVSWRINPVLNRVRYRVSIDPKDNPLLPLVSVDPEDDSLLPLFSGVQVDYWIPGKSEPPLTTGWVVVTNWADLVLPGESK